LWSSTTGAGEASQGLALLQEAPISVPSLYRAIVSYDEKAAFIWQDRLEHGAYVALDRAFLTRLPAGGRVLDLGGGTGANLERLRALQVWFGSYEGVDLSPGMLAQARAKFKDVATAGSNRRT